MAGTARCTHRVGGCQFGQRRAADLDNVTADWTIGTNWTPGGPPGGADTAIINAGNAQLNSDTTILGLNQAGGTISGTGQFTLTGASTWTGGTHTGAGISQFNGTLTVSGAGTKTISGGRIVNAASTAWSGNTGANNNAISIASTSVLNNTGTFTDTNTFNSTVTGGTFNNSGTFSKQSGTTTTVSSVFNNTGTVNVNAGTMLMQSGGTSTGCKRGRQPGDDQYRHRHPIRLHQRRGGSAESRYSSGRRHL